MGKNVRIVGISAGSATIEPRVGDFVYHDGHQDFLLVRFGSISRDGAPVTKLAQFENDDQRVSCLFRDLVYSEKRDAWYLPGRVFPRQSRNDQRDSGCDPLEVEKEFMEYPND